MTHKQICLIFLILTALLAACVREERGVVVGTAVPVQPTPTAILTYTATPTIAVTESRFSSGLELEEDFEDQSNRSDASGERGPIPTPLPLPFPDPGTNRLPKIEVNLETYDLQPPEDVLLLELLVMLSLKAKQQIPTMSHFEELIMADIDTYYGGDLPSAYLLLGNKDLSFIEQVSTPLESSWKTIRTAVIQYLNNRDLIGSPPLRINSYSLDLDRDGQEDLLVQFDALWHSISGVIPLKLLDEDSYVLIPNDFPPESTNILYENTLFPDHDISGDGQPEIIWHTRSYWGRGNFEEIRVFAWSGEKIELVKEIDLSRPAYSFFPEFSIADFTGDNVDDVRVTIQQSGNFDCELFEVYLYIWSGSGLQQENKPQVNTPACQLWRATSSHRDVQEKTEFLEGALAQWESAASPPADLIALTRLHLALAQYASGNYQEAQSILDAIASLPEGAQFARLVDEAYVEAEQDPLQTCRNVLSKAEQALTTDIGNFLTKAVQGWGYGGDGELPHLPTICNIQETAAAILATANLPVRETPPDLLADLGIRFDFATAVNLDDDSDLEWIGVLEPQIGRITTFDAQNGVWAYEIEYRETLAQDFEVAQLDVTGDGQEDVIALITEEKYCYDLDQIGLQQSVRLLYSEDESARFSGSSLSCNPEELLSVENVGGDYFTASPLPVKAAWQTLENYPETDLSLHEYVDELQTAVLTQTDPTVPEKISELLAYLPANDPEAQPYIEHLTYLLGYHYELNGDEETAVTTYLDLIQRFPASPWSWLAWARLEPAPSE